MLTPERAQMQGRGRSDQNRRPSTGRGGPARGTSPASGNNNNPGRASARGIHRPSGRGSASPQAPLPDTAPPPGLPGPPRLGPLPEATQQAPTITANGPAGRIDSSNEARHSRQGRTSQDGPSRGPKQPGGRAAPRAPPSGPGRGRVNAGGPVPRTSSDKGSTTSVRASGQQGHPSENFSHLAGLSASSR